MKTRVPLPRYGARRVESTVSSVLTCSAFVVGFWFMAETAKLNFLEAMEHVVTYVNRFAGERLRELLEAKHLYQKVSFDPTEIISATRSRLHPGTNTELFDDWLKKLPRERLILASGPDLYLVPRTGTPELILALSVRNVKLYCSKCQRREAFIPAWYTDFANEYGKRRHDSQAVDFSLPIGFQLLFLVYQCQSCRGEPESFLVRRKGWDFQLHGRSPIEGLEVPNYIPKPEYNLFRDALIAFNSGKILAALFYLRSFIEQFARRVTNKHGKVTGEEIMDAYYETLPREHSSSMPSLREWYDKLSVPLHEARDDAQMFEEARKKIEKHFEIRKVFDIPEV
jgi:hypothetical protein